MRFPPPHGVEEGDLQSPPPYEVEENNISSQNYLIFAEFRAGTLANTSTSWGGGECFAASFTP